MNIEAFVDSDTITNKMGILLVLIVGDVIGQSLMLYGDAESERFNAGSTWMIMLYAASGL
jgi:hypothetical protein